MVGPAQPVVSLSEDQVHTLRLRAQRLTPLKVPEGSSVVSVVRDIFGIQAQDALADMLSMRVRSAGLLAADVDRALVQERSIVRTWAMRGTLHFIPADDL